MAPGIIAVDVRHRSTLMKSDWFGTAISNPGFMHSLLATIALHAYVFGKDTMDAVLYHRAQAIAAVNAAILTPDGISDANIGLKESLNALVELVLFLIADLNVWFSDPENPLDPLDIQNFACVLECSLLTWVRKNEHLVTPLEDALCVALLIFTVRTTEAFKRQSHVHLLHFAASKRLEKALNCTIRTEWQHCPDLLLWILSIGAISAEPSPESTWFVYQTSLACAEFDILSAEALLERLHLCGWVSYKLNDAVCQLWARVVNLRLAPFFEAPLKAEDANSPVGPLQHHVAEPDLNAWESIDWAALSLGLDDMNQGHANNLGDGGKTSDPYDSGVPDDQSCTFGSGYGFTCMYNFERSQLLLIPALLGANLLVEYAGPTTQHPYAHWMNGSQNHHEY
ncbi:hypothetical protein J4E91_007017 [Alternaria rosae]|nr:hypothetical protein J4E91_007017 [Alternaria rosae]